MKTTETTTMKKTIIKEDIEDLHYANFAMESAREFAEVVKNELENSGPEILIKYHHNDRCVCVLLPKNLKKEDLEKAKEINTKHEIFFKYSEEDSMYYLFYLYF